MTSRPAPRTSAILVNGSPHYVSDGAVAQDGVLKLMQCNACGAEVVWATSARTGRKYLVNVSRGHLDQRFYMKRNVHDCGDADARRARTEAETAVFNAEVDYKVALDAYLASDEDEVGPLVAALDAAAVALRSAKAALAEVLAR